MFTMVAEADSHLAGFACVFPNEDAIFGSFLDNLHVAPLFDWPGNRREAAFGSREALGGDGRRCRPLLVGD